MAKNATWSNAERSAMMNAIIADFNSGYLELYDSTGTGQPAGPDTAVTTQRLLSTLRFPATAFVSVVNGVATAGVIVSDPSAALTGTATWYRCYKSDGVTALHDGSIGTATSNLILPTVAVAAGDVVSVSSFVLTEAAASAQ